MNKARILIVEDEAIIAMELESQLQSLGYAVTSIVNSGDEAIKKAEEDRPDLILMDIRIQGDKDGIETAEIIRNRFGTPVVFSTAYLDEERIERAKITMPFGYVLKPIQERDLKVTLEMALYVAKVDAERRSIEEALKKSESLHKEAQSVAHIGHWELNSPLGTPIWSAEVYKIFGLNPETDAPSFLEHRNIIHIEDWPLLEKSIGLLSEESTPFNLQFRIIRSSGEIGWMHAIGTAEINSAGNVTRMFGTAQDITELKRAETEMKRFEDIVNNIQVGLHIYQLENLEDDRTLKLIAANNASEKIIGIKNEEIVDNYIDVSFPELRKKDLPLKYANVVRKSQAIELEDVYYGDDRIVQAWFKVKAFPLPDNCMGAAFENVTERELALQSLKANEEKYRLIVEGVSDGFFILDDNLKVSYFNQAAEKLLGRKREEVLNQVLFDAFPEARGSVFEEKYTYAVKEKEQISFETYFGVKPYENWYNVRVYPFINGIMVFFLVMDKESRHE